MESNQKEKQEQEAPTGRHSLESKPDGPRAERLPGAHLRLKLGASLNVRLMCVNMKYEAKVVGVEQYGYIIIQLRLPQDTLTRLTQNNQVIVQVIVDGIAYGFRSQVVNRITRPAPLLFLAFPDTVERLVLRSDERVTVSLPAHIHGKYGDHDVMIVDMTNSGCRITAKTDLKDPLREIRPGDEVLMSTLLGQGEKFMAPLVTRRVDSQHGMLFVGGQFRDLDNDKARLVAEYVQRIASYTSSLA